MKLVQYGIHKCGIDSLLTALCTIGDHLIYRYQFYDQKLKASANAEIWKKYFIKYGRLTFFEIYDAAWASEEFN